MRDISYYLETAQALATLVAAAAVAEGGLDPSSAAIGSQQVYMDDADLEATIYDRHLLKSRNIVEGPAIVVEMDSTTVILPEHTGEVDALGNILIRPKSEAS